MRKFIGVFFLLAGMSAQAATTNEAFPGRPRFPDVTPISLADLSTRYKEVVIVDVRSKYEYDTLRVKDARNISVGSKKFVDEVRKLRKSTKQPIVFYCNGHTCMKSYKATRKAVNARIPDVFAFDAGIFDWAKKNPQRTVLLGDALDDPKKLISKSEFKKKLLPAKEFSKFVGKKSVLVLDVRGRLQRAGVGLYPFQEWHAPLENEIKLNNFIKDAKKKGKVLMVYDQVGKQVRWLQYRFEKAGIKEYYFMKKGAQGYIDSI
ncbi:MAG: hypothetical protein BMS9Abin36_1478 [Gammaproteobacteria bacterium]|nr:MAG: hypothetical protein BMS9Abin36_1478 [Gammaproteobacteria bacterium]